MEPLPRLSEISVLKVSYLGNPPPIDLINEPCTLGRELVKPRTKKWKWETGDEKMGISFVSALHALFAFNNTWSGLLPQEIAERK